MSSTGVDGAIRYAGDASIYRMSSRGAIVVAYDAYRYTWPRYLNLVSIGIVTLIGITYMIWLMRRSKRTSATTQTGFYLNEKDRYRLALMACVALLMNGFHFIDNFARMEEYHLPRWIYHGIVVPLDWSCAYWHLSTAICLLSATILLSQRHQVDTTSTIVAANGQSIRYLAQQIGMLQSSTWVQRLWFGRWLMYLHCFMIWSGQGHYLFEPPSMFKASANASIFAEGSTAALLHIYTAILATRMIQSCNIATTSAPSVQLSTMEPTTTTTSFEAQSSQPTPLGTTESAPLIDTTTLSASDVIMRRRSRSGGLPPDNL